MKLLPFFIIVVVIFFSKISPKEPGVLYGNIKAQEVENQDKPGEPRQIELIKARSMEFDKKIGDDARRLIGNVILKHEDAYMYCDSAYLYSKDNSLKAFSNIHIKVSDTINIYGDKLYYDGNTSIAELHDNVEMRDKQMVLTTEKLIYDLNENTAKYIDGGKIVDEENELTSLWGFYYADRKHFFFKDNVKLINPDYTMDSDTLKYNTMNETAHFFGPTTIVSEENTIFCKNGWYDTKNDVAQFSKDAFIHNNEQSITGDSLFYDRNKGYGKGLKNVEIKDTVQNAIISGHFGEHFEKKGLSVVTKEAMLTLISDNDSLFMHADTLKYIFKDEHDKTREKPLTADINGNILPELNETTGEETPENQKEKSTNGEKKQEDIRKLLAYNRGKFYRTDLQGMSDSIVYDFRDSTIYMYHEPILWSEEHQLTANNLKIETWDNTVQTVYLNESAFIISQDDTTNFNQIKGREIIGHFNDNKLYKVDVFGNGETIYYVRDEDEDLIGINKAISSNMRIYVKENKVEQIVFIEAPEADLFPVDELPPEERLLKNFEWHINLRPKSKEDIFVWEPIP